MSEQTEQELHNYIENELGAIPLQSDLQSIERIVCRNDLALLRKVVLQAKSDGYLNEELIEKIDKRLELFP